MKNENTRGSITDTIICVGMGMIIIAPIALGPIGLRIFYGVFFSFFYLQLRMIHYRQSLEGLNRTQKILHWFYVVGLAIFIIVYFNLDYWGKDALLLFIKSTNNISQNNF